MPARPAGRQMWRVLLLLLAAAAAELLPTDPGLPIEARAHAVIRAPDAAAAAAIAAAVGGAGVGAAAGPGHVLPEMHAGRPARPPGAAAAPDWALAVLNARAAWNVSVGAGAVVVAPDCGADWTHPDLARVDGAHALNAVEPAATPPAPPAPPPPH